MEQLQPLHTNRNKIMYTLVVASLLIYPMYHFVYVKKYSQDSHSLSLSEKQSREESVALQSRKYAANFREGCMLAGTSTVTLSNNIVLSARFADCKATSSKKFIRPGTFMGYPALFEDTSKTKQSLFPSIVYIKELSNETPHIPEDEEVGDQKISVASNSFVSTITSVQKELLAHIQTMQQADRTRFAGFDVSFENHSGQVFMFLFDKANPNAAGFFDRTSVFVQTSQ